MGPDTLWGVVIVLLVTAAIFFWPRSSASSKSVAEREADLISHLQRSGGYATRNFLVTTFGRDAVDAALGSGIIRETKHTSFNGDVFLKLTSEACPLADPRDC